MEGLFSEKFIMEALLEKLSTLWTSEKIRKLFDKICSLVKSGKSVLPIYDTLKISLEHMITYMVQDVVVLFASNVNLEGLLRWKKQAEGFSPNEKNFIAGIIRLIEVPEANQFSDRLQINPKQVTHKFSAPLSLPFSSFVMTKMISLREKIIKSGCPFDQVFLC